MCIPVLMGRFGMTTCSNVQFVIAVVRSVLCFYVTRVYGRCRITIIMDVHMSQVNRYVSCVTQFQTTSVEATRTVNIVLVLDGF